MKLATEIAAAFSGSFRIFCPPPLTDAQITEEIRVRTESDRLERQLRANLLSEIFPTLFSFDASVSENPFENEGPSLEDYF